MKAILTKRQTQIAELFAWGASKKDVANRLYISERTVENHTRDIYERTGCTKVNELSAWWFCTRFNISFDLNPLKRNIISMMLLGLFILQVPDATKTITRTRSNNTCRVQRTRTRRGDDNDLFIS